MFKVEQFSLCFYSARVLAAALHQAKLEPPVFAGDGVIHPEDWLHSINTYRSSLDLTDVQVLRELPRFLAKEPRKWFSVLNPHVGTWTDFCELFRMVFLPADNQERIMRGILDRIQRPSHQCEEGVCKPADQWHMI